MGDGRREKLYSIANSLTKRHTVLVVIVLALCRGGGQITALPRLRDAYQWLSVSGCWSLPPSPGRGQMLVLIGAHCTVHTVVAEQ